jgi:hypothetical protein
MEVKNRRTMEVKTEIEPEMEMKCGSCVRGFCFHLSREWIQRAWKLNASSCGIIEGDIS